MQYPCWCSVQPDPSELQDLAALLNDRESAIKQGMRVDRQRYEVGATHSSALAS